jgi:hypothetical protein
MSLLYHAVHSQPTEHDDLVVCRIPEATSSNLTPPGRHTPSEGDRSCAGASARTLVYCVGT